MDTLPPVDTLNLVDTLPAITHSLVAIHPPMDSLDSTHSLNPVGTLSLEAIQNLEVMSPPSQ